MPILIPILLCLLLGGCASPTAQVPEPTLPPSPAPDILEYGGCEVEGYVTESLHALYPVAEGYLLVSGAEELTLTLWNSSLTVTAEAEPGTPWDAEQFRLWDTAAGIACYAPGPKQILFRNADLTESRRVTLPQNLTAPPVLSGDGNTVYYTIPGSLYRWDLRSGIRQRIKELDTEAVTLVALHCQDTVLQYVTQDKTCLIRTEDGALIRSQSGAMELTTRGDDYYAVFPTGLWNTMVFGSGDHATGLYPRDLSGDGYFLPEAGLAITQSGERLEVYDLTSGNYRDCLTLESGHKLNSLHSGKNGEVVLLLSTGEGSLILFWQPAAAATDICYTETYCPDDTPDTTQWALCQSYARELEQRYGIAIRIGKDATAHAPWDYRFQSELQTPVILRMLTELNECLSQFPEPILPDTAGQFDSLTLCLVRSVSGYAGEASLNAATGLQFLEGKDAYIAIAAGDYAPQSLCHELFHVMETRILSTSNALDDWEKHNPSGFSYSLDYGSTADRSVYLSGQHRAFVDHYSMTYPKEDRARIFEYAMLPDQASVFSSDIMQEKLQAICTGIREAYGLGKYEGELLWEQYLD